MHLEFKKVFNIDQNNYKWKKSNQIKSNTNLYQLYRVASPIKLNLIGLHMLGNFFFSFSTKNNINTNYK